MDLIYLDNNATTQPAGPVVEAMDQALTTGWANPSSVHRFGQLARQRVELARQATARLIGARDRELIFTSGGTESDNLALRGTLEPALVRKQNPWPPVLITTRLEHAAVREPAEQLAERGVQLVWLPVDRDGTVNPDELAAVLQEHAGTGGLTLVSIQWANNETGLIQPIEQLAAVCQRHRANHPGGRLLLHSDATQAVGKIRTNVKEAGVDLATFSAHKFHGPKGAGVLVVRGPLRLGPVNLGGPQERDRRGGTENVPAIVGLGAAAELACQFLDDAGQQARLAALRERFEEAILAAFPNTVVHCRHANRLWNTSNLGFPHLAAEAILLGLSEKGLCASAGAACSSGSLEPSTALVAMGVPEPIAHGSVRFSLGRFSSAQDIEQAIGIVPDVVRRLQRAMPLGQPSEAS